MRWWPGLFLALLAGPAWGQGSQPVCVRDAPAGGPHRQLCLQATPQGGVLSYNPANGAPPLPMTCNVNGTVISNCLTGGSAAVPDPTWGVNVKQYGAVGDGVADDTAAIQGAVNAVENAAGPFYHQGGEVFFPTGRYCVTSPIQVTSPAVTLRGTNRQAAYLMACNGADTSLLVMSGVRDKLVSLGLLGSENLNTTKPVVTLAPGCTECTVWDAYILFGSNGIYVNVSPPPAGIEDVWIGWSTIFAQYGSGPIYLVNSGGYLFRDKLDQAYPAGYPAAGSQPTPAPPWQPNHAYTAQQYVQIGSYLLQAMTSGTSGGPAPPALQRYTVPIPDGGVTWQLLSPAVYYGIQLDTHVGYDAFIQDVDLTAPFSAAIAFTNTQAGDAPGSIYLDRDTIGVYREAGILIEAGWGIDIQGSHFGGCVGNPCTAIMVTGGGNDLLIRGNYFNNGTTGINLASGDRGLIADNLMGPVGTAVAMASPACCFTITGNTLGSSGVWGGNAVGVALGAGVHYVLVTNNSFVGGTAGIVDASGQTSNILAPNIGP